MDGSTGSKITNVKVKMKRKKETKWVVDFDKIHERK